MLIQPIDYFLVVWFVLAAACTAYVAWDQFRGNPEPSVMRWAFVLITLYMGPIGLLLYVLADKEPRPGQHEAFVEPLWKQGIGSTIHCVAGDATGIIVAAVVTASLGLPMWQDLIVEYLAGFSFGLFVFQALFMRKIMGGTYLENVRRSFVPEFISMNMVMAAMAPAMSFLMMGRDMHAMDPTELLFWGVMSLSIIAGFALAYPMNVWLVLNKIKHGLMTARPGAEPGKTMAGMDHGDGDKPYKDDKPTEGAMAGMDHGDGAKSGKDDKPRGGAMGGMGHGGGKKDDPFALTRSQLVAMGGISVFALALGMIMDRDTPAEAMLDMAAVDPRDVTATYGLATRGDRELAPRIENGVKVFDLTTSVIRWAILPDKSVDAYAFNGQVPGPRLHFRQGDRVRINVVNHLPESTTVHWHGLIVPNVMDGPPTSPRIRSRRAASIITSSPPNRREPTSTIRTIIPIANSRSAYMAR